MDFSGYAPQEHANFSTEQKESHWQPALRPNDEDMEHATPESSKVVSSHIQHTERPSITSQLSYHDDDDDDNDLDVPSTSDDEERVQLDPAWGIARTDSAHILDTIRRTTSFPRPVVDQALFTPQPDSHEVFTGYTIDHASIPQPLPQLQSPAEQEAYSQDQETLESAYQMNLPLQEDQLMPDSPALPGQDESRFDEGVPLIQESYAAQSDPAARPQPRLAAFDELDTEAPEAPEADGFFAHIEPDSSSLFVPNSPVLERKGTNDVLSGLGMQSATPDSPPPTDAATPAYIEQSSDAKDLAAAFATLDGTDDDPWKAALGDDDDFLVEDADDLLPDSDSETDVTAATISSQPNVTQPSRQHPPNASQPRSNMYAPHQPSTSELTQFGGTTHNTVGLSRQVSNPMTVFQPQQPPNITNRAASYVDQSKGGYKSPYDLPMDLAPKRKAQAPRTIPQLNNLPPPPRSSSINADRQLQSPFTPTAPSFSQQMMSPPASAAMPPPAKPQRIVAGRPQPPTKRMSSGFFEELPMAARVRPSTANATVPLAPITQTPLGPPQVPTPDPTSYLMASPPSLPIQNTQLQSDPYAQYQLQQPERLDPYANAASQTSQPTQPPPINSRYSPAPPSVPIGMKPTPSPRYSPAPPPQVNGGQNRYVSQPILPSSKPPFLPRTSSPLAQQRKSVDRSIDSAPQQRPGVQQSLPSSVPYAAQFSQVAASTLSPPRGIDPTRQVGLIPPQRSQTQSPGRQVAKPIMATRIVPPPQKPATTLGQLSPTRTVPEPNILSPPRVILQHKYTDEVEYIRPSDGTEHDALERWKGTPIFNFGFGGTVVTSFPTRVPRFNSTATRPQIKVSSGEVVVKKMEDWGLLEDYVKKFPGPLKGKAKKKDVLIWLTSTVASFENQAMSFPGKNLEEKILLWKIMRVLVEQDGNLDGPQAVQSVSEILMPSVYAAADTSSSQYRAEDTAPGIYRPASVSASTETVNPVAVEGLRKTLLRGKREDAVWQAVDTRLWAHALLLSSTLDKTIWKQVVQEFVKQEVKAIGANAESLCALYEIFGGNLEESVDQLVPPSARAGLQMVSKVDTAGPTRNALDGLDRWRETLCLVLNNRSNEDQRALVTLARLLSDYGRIEASHICYLFARNVNLPNMFGGADDPNTHIVLLGADHRQKPLSFHNDTDAIMLSEVFEFAISTLATGSTGAPMPHLATYKLQRANELTDAGMKTEAQAYCEGVASGLKSSTKHSLYYNPILLSEVENLSNRLKQVPVQSSSWIAKPSIEKASNSVWNKFSSFVTGEDSDAESKGSARDAAEAGPFAKVSGSPTLSRNTSQTDLYGSYPTMTPSAAPATATGSRYAPNGMNSARSSTDLTRARMSFEAQRSPPSTSHSNEGRSLYAPAVQPQQQSQYSPLGMSPQATGYQPSPEAYMPAVVEETTPQYNSYMPQVAQPMQNGHSPEPSYGGYQPAELSPHLQPEPDSAVESVSTFEPPQLDYGGYEPPEDTGYTPYQPDPDSDDDAAKSKPRKKSYMDDDGDDNFGPISKKSTSSKPTPPPASTGAPDSDTLRRKANDDAADAAFRAAAEADAQSNDKDAKSKKASGSWLGGWFGGAKKPDSLDGSNSSASKSASAAASKVHRVHLGESKMKLYYDEGKKKWINPDNPDAGEKKAAAPPPRGSTGSVPPPSSSGGPPRSTSTSHNLPAGGLSRSGTPASVAIDSDGGDSRPGSSSFAPSTGFAAMLPPGTKESLGLGGPPTPLPTPPGSSSGPPSAGMGAPGFGGLSGPPSRPASALSNASGLDDLLGAPTGGRKVSGRAVKAKKGRYVDVMAK